jgi:hypothetical protein
MHKHEHFPFFWHSYHVIHSSVLLTDHNIVNRFFSYCKGRDLNPRAIALKHLISLQMLTVCWKKRPANIICMLIKISSILMMSVESDVNCWFCESYLLSISLGLEYMISYKRLGLLHTFIYTQKLTVMSD